VPRHVGEIFATRLRWSVPGSLPRFSRPGHEEEMGRSEETQQERLAFLFGSLRESRLLFWLMLPAGPVFGKSLSGDAGCCSIRLH
jgi:hypothetical protein